MQTVLIVDDEANITEVLKEYASREGYDTLTAYNGLEAVDTVKRFDNIDCIIMDIMMPYMDGFSAAKEIKKIKDIPTIMLSARGEEIDKLRGFEIGVDDYIVKPFSPREVMARIKAVLKRAKTTEVPSIIEGLTIDKAGRTIFVDGRERKLTAKEYELLLLLVKNKGIALSRETILNEVWGDEFDGFDRTIDAHIKMLRKNLGIYKKFITTIRGIGYKFDY